MSSSENTQVAAGIEESKKTPIKCYTCGKRIRKGATIWGIRGYIYRCCSAQCLLYAHVNYYTAESKGYEED